MAAVVGVAALGAVAWVAFGYFGVHLLFIDDEVDEAAPVFDSGATVPASPTTGDTASGGAETTVAPSPSTSVPPVETVAVGSFIARSHPASGRAVVLTDGSQTFVRFEDFETDNGPDLFVYLSRGVTADGPEGAFDDDFVNLGELKGNVGEQNYEVPQDVDVGDYSTVVVWCREFAVAFGAADLT